MSQDDCKKLNNEKGKNIQPIFEEKRDEIENVQKQDEFREISQDKLAEDFDFFPEESKRRKNLFIVEETIEEIKKEKNNDNDLDEYIKDCIENLEEYSSIFSFEDLIYDPEYTLKCFMKSLKKIINFHSFYTKFTIPKEKIEQKQDEEKAQKSGNGVNDNTHNSKRNKKRNIESKNLTKDKNQNKENKDLITEDKKDTEQKIEEKIEQKNEGEKNVAQNNEGQQDNKTENKENLNNSLTNNINNSFSQKNNRKKNRNILEKNKTDFIFKLSIKEKNNSSQSEKQLKSISQKDKSEEGTQFNFSSSENSKKKSKFMINEKSDTLKDETLSRLEEYKLMNYDNILSIINNNANIEEVELIEGKNYESKVRKYFQVVLDICSDKLLSVHKNSGTTIQGLYKYYEDFINKNKIEKNSNISGASNRKKEYNILEFDLMVDNVGKNVIKKIVDVFKSNIIAKNWDENNTDKAQYQIVGEVAKNILNQSIDKYKQIGKIIDILLIEQYLSSKEIMELDNSFVNEIIKEYNSLKLNINQNKFIFIFTDGSFIELKQSLLFKEFELDTVNNDYLSIDIKSLFPIKNKKRYCKNIMYLKKIIQCLNKSGFPYIIFYLGDEINNGTERILLNYIKNKKDNNKYNSIISKIEENEKLISKNISQSFFIKTINKRLSLINKDQIFKIIQNIINGPSVSCWKYFDFIAQNLIERKETKDKYYILFIVESGLKIPSQFENIIKDFNNKNYLIRIEILSSNKEELSKNYSKYNNKKVIKLFIFIQFKEDKDYIKEFGIEGIEAKDIKIIDYENYLTINFVEMNGDLIKEIIVKYILSNFSHFSEEKYLNLDIFHKKIIFDIKNLENILPIKSKKINEDKILVEKIRNIFNELVSDDIIKKNSEYILDLIKECIGEKLNEYLLKTREEYIKHILNRNLKRISEHIFCFSIYDKFFRIYLPSIIYN